LPPAASSLVGGEAVWGAAEDLVAGDRGAPVSFDVLDDEVGAGEV
jgi:hypothetical protein